MRIATIPGCSGYNMLWDRGYKIQRTIPGGFYHWHNDFGVGDERHSDFGERLVTFIWYLNDVDEGGETEFMDGTKVKPKQGSDVLPMHLDVWSPRMSSCK